MELRHLRYFVAVAEEQHVTRAAERLGMQQPPLSQQIRILERELDVQLFRRLPRGVALTAAGVAFLADARAILAQLDHAVATAKRTARGEQGRIAVGFTSSAPFNPFVPRVIRVYREAFPLVALTLEEGGTTELIEGLRNERIDAAFIRTPIADREGLVVQILLEEPMVLALPRGNVLARKKGAIAGGGRRRNIRDLSPAQRSRAARRNCLGLQCCRFQPAHRPGSAAHWVDVESRRRRTWNFPRSGILAADAHGWCRFQAAGRHRAAESAALFRRTAH